MALIIIATTFCLLAVIYHWHQGHSGFWRQLAHVYGAASENGSIIPRILRYRKSGGAWQYWNMFVISCNSEGFHIKSLFSSFIYPGVSIPCEKIKIIREESLAFLKSGIVEVEGVSGEISIPYSYFNQVKQYAQKSA